MLNFDGFPYAYYPVTCHLVHWLATCLSEGIHSMSDSCRLAKETLNARLEQKIMQFYLENRKLKSF